MKISRILSENILPNTIGTIVFIGYFLIKDKLSNQSEANAFENHELSNTVYFIFIAVITFLSCLYHVIIGRWILKRTENSFLSNVINIIVFATVFTGILIIMEFVSRNTFEIKFYGMVFLGMIILAVLHLALKKWCRKLFNGKFLN